MRRYDWQSRFAAFVKEKQASQFEWGKNDCCLFACDAIEVLTGIDPAQQFRGKYSDIRGAVAVVRDYCGGDLFAMIEKVAEEMGMLEVPPRYAQRGDIGLYRDPAAGPALGVCVGKNFVFLMADGITAIPTASVERSWRVG